MYLHQEVVEQIILQEEIEIHCLLIQKGLFRTLSMVKQSIVYICLFCLKIMCLKLDKDIIKQKQFVWNQNKQKETMNPLSPNNSNISPASPLFNQPPISCLTQIQNNYISCSRLRQINSRKRRKFSKLRKNSILKESGIFDSSKLNEFLQCPLKIEGNLSLSSNQDSSAACSISIKMKKNRLNETQSHFIVPSLIDTTKLKLKYKQELILNLIIFIFCIIFYFI